MPSPIRKQWDLSDPKAGGSDHGGAMGSSGRRRSARADATGAHRTVGRRRGPGAGLRDGAGAWATPSGTTGPGLATGAGCLSAAQSAGQRGALPALGSQHSGGDAGWPRPGPGLGVSVGLGGRRAEAGGPGGRWDQERPQNLSCQKPDDVSIRVVRAVELL